MSQIDVGSIVRYDQIPVGAIYCLIQEVDASDSRYWRRKKLETGAEWVHDKGFIRDDFHHTHISAYKILEMPSNELVVE